jgi:hypothetical protein
MESFQGPLLYSVCAVCMLLRIVAPAVSSAWLAEGIDIYVYLSLLPITLQPSVEEHVQIFLFLIFRS